MNLRFPTSVVQMSEICYFVSDSVFILKLLNFWKFDISLLKQSILILYVLI
jgi:hypothetical protein